jgi:murein DD-endopeptidase MepM/ murein hydrolase activator NlpD
MRRGVAAVGAAAYVVFGTALPGDAGALPWVDDGAAAEERLLGAADDAERAKTLLRFTRELGVGGVVTGSLADSLAIAGVPAATSLDALRALRGAVDLERDVRTGDRFHVRYEQAFTVGGDPIGVGKVLWLELRTKARGTVAVHRFRPKGGAEQFWLASGQAAGLPMMRQPLAVMTVTSGFGLRADPLDHPPSNVTPSVVEVPVAAAPAREVEASAQEMRAANRAYAGFDMGTLGGAQDALGRNSELDRIMAARRIRQREAEERRREEEAVAAAKAASDAAKAAEPAPARTEETPAGPLVRKLFMHEGLDLLANTGTPVFAAADGVVIGAGPNGGYGNFIRLGHAGRLATIYGHLAGFAPGLQAGRPVLRGEVIGFVGSTGRSTGAHLHFEIQADGRPVDPAASAAMRPAQLAGADLAAFRKLVAGRLAERERELAAR